MILSFRDKETEKIWQDIISLKLPCEIQMEKWKQFRKGKQSMPNSKKNKRLIIKELPAVKKIKSYHKLNKKFACV